MFAEHLNALVEHQEDEQKGQGPKIKRIVVSTHISPLNRQAIERHHKPEGEEGIDEPRERRWAQEGHERQEDNNKDTYDEGGEVVQAQHQDAAPVSQKGTQADNSRKKVR